MVRSLTRMEPNVHRISIRTITNTAVVASIRTHGLTTNPLIFTGLSVPHDGDYREKDKSVIISMATSLTTDR